MKELRHTTSHILAQAVKRIWPDAKLAIGPAIENGFYYDFDLEHRFSDEDLKLLEKEMSKIIKENLKLERKVISRDEALELFKEEPYKLELISDIPEGEDISTYRQGDFIDLCAGPHVESTGQVKAFKLLNVAGAYWRGDEHNKMLQRIYGTAFTDKKELIEYLELLKKAAEADHRKLGRELFLFGLHEEAPGMPFFYPNGMIIMNELLAYWREVHRKYGYQEIRTPIMLKRQLWETSGHWDHYAQGMYTLKVDGNDYAIKPMNCPGSLVISKFLQNAHYFKKRGEKLTSSTRRQDTTPPEGQSTKSAKLAEIGVVHRAEKTGQLHGIMRVREFTQDDAHIYVEMGEVETAVLEVIGLAKEVYGVLGMGSEMELSTRPLEWIGTEAAWEAAEAALERVLKKTGEYKVNAGDGAFYGPKIDMHIRDALGRRWQCGTVQLDFNLPARFGVSGVMIHRVIFGSIERFIGILTEHFRGAYPVWLSPEQARVVTVSERNKGKGERVKAALEAAGIRVGSDYGAETLGKKVRKAAAMKVPYTVIIGDAEEAGGDLHLRRFGAKTELVLPLDYAIRYIRGKIERKALTY